MHSNQLLYLSDKSLGNPARTTRDQHPHMRPCAHLTQNIVWKQRLTNASETIFKKSMQGTSHTSLGYFPRYHQTAVSLDKANNISATTLELQTMFYPQESVVSIENLISNENQMWMVVGRGKHYFIAGSGK